MVCASSVRRDYGLRRRGGNLSPATSHSRNRRARQMWILRLGVFGDES